MVALHRLAVRLTWNFILLSQNLSGIPVFVIGLILFIIMVLKLVDCGALIHYSKALLLLLFLPIGIWIVFALSLLDDLLNPFGRDVFEVILAVGAVTLHQTDVVLGAVGEVDD